MSAGANETDAGWMIYACPKCDYVLPPGRGSGLICSDCYEAECEPVPVVVQSDRALWNYHRPE